MNPLATELNQDLEKNAPKVLSMLGSVGKNLFFPKGILSQSAEAKEKAHKFNATIGIATEEGRTMYIPSIMESVTGIPARSALRYAPSFGVPELRQAWQKLLFQKNPSLQGKVISLPIVSQAITHGISVFGDMWMDAGDVLVLPDKFWGNYNLILSVRRGVRLSHYTLFNDQGGFNLEAFEAKVKEEAAKNDKITVMLNFPNNPSGYTPTKEEAAAIAKILTEVAEAGTFVLAVSDDAYFGLFYDDACAKESIFAQLADASENLIAVKLDGATKEDFVWGLRVGFITYGTKIPGDPAPVYNALERKTAGAVRGSISNASHLSQSIVLKAMESKSYDEERKQKRDILQARAVEVKRVLDDPKFAGAWDVYPFNSGYFMCLKLKTVDAETLRVHLLDKYGVGLISLGPTDLRVAFSCLEEKDVQELFDIVLAGIKDLEKG
ncbi:Aspartate/methionine/tyrosine aminotransferase [Desulfatibacillum alkenivorans DSM 16219]|jgi:aspartate/methionine/tyrosine aminotransferase|uniref:Aspartate/methionine/tyrosine aminotransferase n=1 Tax=Desulfatibacillum alkenivorans DSM 16219 TaxID=1121393 RepID=A0A1M6TE00_9BACT|nr:aminotransferase class I/II-fold pyridoxal phosphate-dependent enzyme [Desulfatibacillum alkenivorans]SHK55094.1 Aspartate/methionine/tyrosine aminotransferase [Desulfatibacillum alkenivorans DSM 16219]